ncbi:MAG: MFS transporter [Firmicutes bacterium HGW-Firmicutes-10]|nr:MAG: MFS transporter [Firmicutes bacterium HGW-Firmicutes-10]
MRKSFKSYGVLMGAVLIQLCIGGIYTWSLFNQPLADAFGWNKSDVFLTYSIAIFVFAFATLFAGRLQDRFGPRLVATIGISLYSGGLMLTSLASELWQLYITYGIIAGAGVGFVYVCPLSTLVKWFPKRKGMITGVAVGAFGLGSLVFKSAIQYFISTLGVSQTFFALGLISALIGLIGASLLSVPPAVINVKGMANATIDRQFAPGQMVKTRSFALIWIMFLFASTSGLLVIGMAKDIGVQLAGLSEDVAANAVTIIALFNAGGRIGWGTLSDKFGRIRVVSIMFLMTAAAMTAISILTLSYITFFISLAIIAFCFGGFLAVFPTITNEYFGVKNLGANYGIVYQAYGLAALMGPLIVSALGSLKMTFLIAAVLAVLGAMLTRITPRPDISESSSGVLSSQN